MPDKVEPGRRNQRRESRWEIERFEHDMRRAVAPAVPEVTQDLAIGQNRLVFGGNRRTGDITAKILQLALCPDGDADICVQAETGEGEAPGRGAKRTVRLSEWFDSIALLSREPDFLAALRCQRDKLRITHLSQCF
jgi:hypothetical protein